MNKKAFTLLELMVIIGLIVLLSTVAYRMMTGTFLQFFRTQTRLTNLRAATVILELFKRDIRLALPSGGDPPVLSETNLEFTMLVDGQPKRVKYSYSNGDVMRDLEGEGSRVISMVPVSNFKIKEVKGQEVSMLIISFSVDKDKELQSKSSFDEANIVELSAVMYPRFYNSSLSTEELYWIRARQSGGVP